MAALAGIPVELQQQEKRLAHHLHGEVEVLTEDRHSLAAREAAEKKEAYKARAEKAAATRKRNRTTTYSWKSSSSAYHAATSSLSACK